MTHEKHTPTKASSKQGKEHGIFSEKKPALSPTPPAAAVGKTQAPAATTSATPEKTKPEKAPCAEKEKVAKKEVLTARLGSTKKSGLQRFIDGLNSFGLGKERAHFIENLAVLLNSGLSVVDALKTIQLELRIKAMKKVIGKIIDEVESGIALWQAMDNQGFFSPYALALIRIGEESGALSRNMEYLSVQQEKDRSLRAKVQMAMIYPSIVLVLTVIVTLGLAWFVLPQLVTVLLSLNAELPFVTRMIIWIANFMKAHGNVAVPLFLTFLLLVTSLCKYTRLRGPTQQFIFRLPGVGTMARSATIARFGVILGSLLRAGVPLVESIHSMADVTDTVAYRKFYYRLANAIEVGQSFASAFSTLKETSSLIPISVQQLIVTGEKSGRMADMLMRIADIYEKKAEESAARLPVVLEPILLIFIGVLVGTIAFAIIVPIYSIVGSVGR
jgi:type IV pilus assembly protein PilC